MLGWGGGEVVGYYLEQPDRTSCALEVAEELFGGGERTTAFAVLRHPRER